MMLKDGYRQAAEVIMHYFCFCHRKLIIKSTKRLSLTTEKALFCWRDKDEASPKVAVSHKQG